MNKEQAVIPPQDMRVGRESLSIVSHEAFGSKSMAMLVIAIIHNNSVWRQVGALWWINALVEGVWVLSFNSFDASITFDDVENICL